MIIRTVFVPSIGPKIHALLKAVFQRASTVTHQTVLGKNGAPSHTPFLRGLLASTDRKPTVQTGGTRHRPCQWIMIRWHINTRSRPDCQLDRSDMPFGDISRPFCSTVGLRVAFCRCSWCKSRILVDTSKHHSPYPPKNKLPNFCHQPQPARNPGNLLLLLKLHAEIDLVDLSQRRISSSIFARFMGTCPTSE